jgi:hypothetical protein
MDYIADNFSGNAVHVYESYKGMDGRYYYRDSNGKVNRAPNGMYVNGEIWVDLRSGDNQEGLVLNTFAHEMYHHIERFDKAKAQELAEFVVKELGMESVDKAVEAQIQKARKAGLSEAYFMNVKGMTAEQARNEVYMRAMSDFVADSLETMFTRGDPAKAIADLKKENRTLFDQIKAFIDKWVSKLKDFYKDKTVSEEGAVVAQLKNFEQLQKLFMEGVQSAGENYRAAEVGDEKNVPREEHEKFSFAGRESATADKSALQQAEELAQKGVDNESIRKQTGWYKGMDGKWRYEIDDSQMEITDDIINYMSLGELMQHEKLYAAYPDLADISVVFQGLDKGVRGAYNPQFDSINLSYRLKNDPFGLKDALVHEIQHAIQHREGFTGGATVGQWERKIKAGFDSRRAADIRKAQDTERELRRIQNEEPEFYRDMMELDAMTPDLPRGEVNWETLEKISDDPIEWKQYDTRREELEAKYGDTKVWDMNDLLYQREQAAKNIGRSGLELYFDTAGEIEARDAANRRNKTSEQRKSSPPRLGNEDTVFAEGNADVAGKFSLRNEKSATDRDILMNLDANAQKVSVKGHLQRYQDRVSQLFDLESRRELVNAQIKELSSDTKKNRKELAQLRSEARNLSTQIKGLNEKLMFTERSDMMRSLVAKKRLNDQRIVNSYKEEQKDLIRSMREEHRVIRKELTGADSVMFVMEDTFLNLAKDYEAKKIDLKTMEKEYLRLAKEYDKQTKDLGIWEREFKRLLKLYNSIASENTNAKNKIERLEATILRQRATAKARVEGRRKTEMRHKIQRKADELNRLLTHGTKHRNIPENLQPAVADILNAINMEVRDGEQRRKTYEATIDRYDRQIELATDPLVKEALIEKRDSYAAKGDQFANNMAKLKKVYEQIRKDANTNIEIDDGLAGMLETLFEKVGDTPLGQMTMEQLEAVNDVLKITKKTIVEANKLHQEGQRKGVEETSKNAIREIRTVGGGAKKTIEIAEAVKKFGWDNLKPVYVFEAIGSKVMTGLFNNLRKGEDTLARDLQEGRTFFQNQWQKHKGENWDKEKKWAFTSTSGKRFELDLMQIMSLYALSKRDQARDHLRVGGFSFDSQYKVKDEVKIGPLKFKADVKTTDASAYNLSDETLGEIIGKLTAEQRAFVDEMQAYLSDTMAAKGNEISMQKYGIRLFKEKNYFPLRVSDQYMAKAREQQTGDRKLKNSGFTKETTPNAKNPVVLSSFLDVWAEHVDEMSLYHSFVLPLDDMSRVLNYHDAFLEENAASSVVEAIRTAYGEGATQYIDQLIRDINGGSRADGMASTINKLMSTAKKTQTMASLSVAIQQPTSILRACAEIDGKYFLGRRVTEKCMTPPGRKSKNTLLSPSSRRRAVSIPMWASPPLSI